MVWMAAHRRPDLLEVPLELLQCGVVISALGTNTFKRVDIRYGSKWSFPVRRNGICRVFNSNISHGAVVMDVILEVTEDFRTIA